MIDEAISGSVFGSRNAVPDAPLKQVLTHFLAHLIFVDIAVHILEGRGGSLKDWVGTGILRCVLQDFLQQEGVLGNPLQRDYK